MLKHGMRPIADVLNGGIVGGKLNFFPLHPPLVRLCAPTAECFTFYKNTSFDLSFCLHLVFSSIFKDFSGTVKIWSKIVILFSFNDFIRVVYSIFVVMTRLSFVLWLFAGLITVDCGPTYELTLSSIANEFWLLNSIIGTAYKAETDIPQQRHETA